MAKRAFRHKTGDGIEPCPKCANRIAFVGLSQQVAEDLCEVWVTCKCGYAPGPEHRMEDVWGSLDPETLSCALQNCWNAALSV